MVFGDFFKNIQQLVGFREDEPDTLLGDKIDTNNLSRNDAKVISNSLNNIYNNVSGKGELEISFEKVDSERSGIAINNNSFYQDEITSILSSGQLEGLEGAYRISIQEKADYSSRESQESKRYRTLYPDATTSEINNLADKRIAYDNLVGLGLDKTEAFDIVTERFNESDSVLENFGEGVKGGLSAGTIGTVGALSYIGSSIVGGDALKQFSDKMYLQVAKDSTASRGLVNSIGGAAGFAGSLVVGGGVGKGVGVGAKVLGASPQAALKIGNRTGSRLVNTGVISQSLVGNILKPIEQDTFGGILSRDSANFLLDVGGVTFNKWLSNMSPQTPLRVLYNKNPITANSLEAAFFEAAHISINPDLRAEENIGNLLSAFAFNVASINGLKAGEVKKLQEITEVAYGRMQATQKTPQEVFKDLDADYDFNGIKPSKLLDDVLTGDPQLANLNQISFLSLFKGGNLTNSSIKALEMNEQRTRRNEVNKTVNNTLAKIASSGESLISLQQAKKQGAEILTGVSVSSGLSARLNALDTRRAEIDSPVLVDRKDELNTKKVELESKEFATKKATDANKNKITEIKKEISSINTKLREDKAIEKEIKELSDSVSIPTADSEADIIKDSITEPINNLVRDGIIDEDFVVSEIANKLTGGIDLLRLEGEAFQNGKVEGNKFIAQNEGLYTKTPIKNLNGEITGYNFKARIAKSIEGTGFNMTTEQYQKAKDGNFRAKKIQHERTFKKVKSVFKKRFPTLRKQIRDEVKAKMKDKKYTQKQFDTEVSKRMDIEQKVYFAKIHVDATKAYINDNVFTIGKDVETRNDIRNILNKIDNTGLDTPDKVATWYLKADKAIYKYADKKIKETEANLLKEANEFNKRKKAQLRFITKGLDKKDNAVVRKTAGLIKEDRENLERLLADWRQAKKTFLSGNQPTTQAYNDVMTTRRKLDEEFTYLKSNKVESVQSRENKEQAIIDSIVPELKNIEETAVKELIGAVSKNYSTLNNLGPAGRKIAQLLERGATVKMDFQKRYFESKKLIALALNRNGLTYDELYITEQYKRSKRTRQKSLDKGNKDFENFNNGWHKDKDGKIVGSKNKWFMDSENNLQFTDSFSLADAEQAIASGWRFLKEQDLENYELKFNEARAKDKDLDAGLEGLRVVNRDVGRILQRIEYQKSKGSNLPALEDEYIFARLWDDSASYDAIQKNKTTDLTNSDFDSVGGRFLEEVKQQTGQISLNMDESAQDMHFNQMAFMAAHYDNVNVINKIGKAVDKKGEGTGKVLKVVTDNLIKSNNNISLGGWQKVASMGLKGLVFSSLAGNPTQLLTSKYIYGTLAFTNPGLLREIATAKAPGGGLDLFSSEMQAILPAFERRIKTQSGATDIFDSISQKGITGKRGVFEVFETIAMSFSSAADEKSAFTIAEGLLIQSGKQIFKAQGKRFNRKEYKEFLLGNNNLGLTKEVADELRVDTKTNVGVDFEDILVSNTVENSSRLQAESKLLAGIEFALKRSALGEATRVSDILLRAKNSKNPALKRIQFGLGMAALSGVAVVAKEISVGYSILAGEVASEIASENEDLEFQVNPILYKESLAGSLIQYLASSDEVERNSIARRWEAKTVLGKAVKDVVGLGPFAGAALGEGEFGDNLLQSSVKSVLFAINAEDGVDKSSQFYNTLAIGLPSLYKTKMNLLKQEAKNQREYNQHLMDLQDEGLPLEAYDTWKEEKLVKQLVNQSKDSQEEKMAQYDDLLLTNPKQYIGSLSTVFPQLNVKELARVAADKFIDDDLLNIGIDDKILPDDKYRLFLYYSEIGDRRADTIKSQMMRYTSPDKYIATEPEVYFKRYIGNREPNEAILYMIRDYEQGLISESKYKELYTYAQTEWFAK